MEIIITVLFIFVIYAFAKISSLEKEVEIIKNKIKTNNLIQEENTKNENLESSTYFNFVNQTKNESLSVQNKEIELEKDYSENKENFNKNNPGYFELEEDENLNISIKAKNKNIKNSDESIEFKLGSRIFTGIGAIAIIFGLGFFLKYSFENNLITPVMRVFLGLFSGFIMLSIGEFTRKKFSNYGQILTGAGLGIFYLSLYAAFGYYNLISHITAFLCMFLTMVLGVFLAVRYNSLILAIFCQIGGLLTPIILSTGENRPHALFLYLTLLNVGIFIIVWYKVWRILVYISFFGTIFIYVGWFASFYDKSQLIIAQSYATLFFIIFLSVLLIHNFVRKNSENIYDLFLAMLNSGFYFVISYIIINENHHNVMDFFVFVLAIFHLLLALLVRNFNKEKNKFSSNSNLNLEQILASVGVILSVIAVPIQFNKYWITIFWAAEGLSLTFFGFQAKSKVLRIFSSGVFTLSFFRLIFIDSQISISNSQPFFNDRVFSFSICIILFILAVTIYCWNKNEVEKTEISLLNFIAFSASVLFLAVGNFEILDFFDHYWLTLFWSLALILIFVFSIIIQSIPLRILTFIISLLIFSRLILFDINLDVLYLNREVIAILNLRVLLFMIAILSSLFVLFLFNFFKVDGNFNKNEINISQHFISTYVYVLFMILVTAEINDFYSSFWLPIFWSFIATLTVFISLKTRISSLRFLSYLTLVTLVFFHLLNNESGVNLESYKPFLNIRVFSFISSAIFMGITLTILKYAKIEELEKKSILLILFLIINFLLIYLLSVELLDYFQQTFLRLPENLKSEQKVRFDNLKNVSLSVGWTIYAIILLILGILNKSKIARLLSMFILGIVIFKVFLFDTASLNTLYKFISFLTLGVILLLTGFLYNNYKDRIVKFINV